MKAKRQAAVQQVLVSPRQPYRLNGPKPSRAFLQHWRAATASTPSGSKANPGR